MEFNRNGFGRVYDVKSEEKQKFGDTWIPILAWMITLSICYLVYLKIKLLLNWVN